MENFWDCSAWGSINLIAVLLISLLAANIIKRKVPFLKNSLIPTSVLGGAILLIVSIIYTAVTDKSIFDTPFFGGNGSTTLEVITYHMLALGFIATSFKPANEKFTKERNIEIFNTGITTVSTYILQGIIGVVITAVAAFLISGIPDYAGILLPFGYGQGTGQALNYGGIYEADYGFIGGKSFGLSVAALGFISAGIGGVIHLNLKKHKKSAQENKNSVAISMENIQGPDEIPMNGSMDKLSVQVAFVFFAYIISYLLMNLVGKLLPSLKSVVYGFNFLFGVLIATLICAIVRKLREVKLVNRQYINTFLMNRISGFCFDIMIIAGVAVIRLDTLKNYWIVLLILGLAGAILTYLYLRFVSKKLFEAYEDEQFLAMYGMLTGTASTGIILLREKDNDFKTPAADNLVYQNLPAIIFGFPIMLLATLAPKQPYLTLIVLILSFVLLNLILFRKYIFKKRGNK